MISDSSSKLTLSVRAIAAAVMLVAAGASVYFVAPATTSASSSGGEDAGRGVLSYRFMRTVDIHNNDTATDRQQVPIALNTSHEIGEGHLSNDCSDVRFTLADEPRRELSYVFNASACDENQTVFWVSVPSIPANTNGPETQV